MPQGAVAKRLGIDQSSLSALENGRRAPPRGPEFIERLRDVLDLTPDEIQELQGSLEASALLPKTCHSATPQQVELGVAVLRTLTSLKPYQIRAMLAILEASEPVAKTEPFNHRGNTGDGPRP
jgi:transcriptional regulator with XRE-family HTH domain